MATLAPKTASEVAIAAAELQHEVAEMVRASRTVSEMPGWRELTLTPEQSHNLIRHKIIESLPGSEVPFILPNDSFTRITVVDGCISIRDIADGGKAAQRIESITEVSDPNLAMYFVLPGSHLSMLADAFPTQVLLLSWRRHVRPL